MFWWVIFRFLFGDLLVFCFESTLLNLDKIGLIEMTLQFFVGVYVLGGGIYIKNTYKTREVCLKILFFIRPTK